jgi:hypothetical protein
MRVASNIVGSLLVLFRAIWLLQGLSVLPSNWAIYGGIAAAAGVALLLNANWRRRNSAGKRKIQPIR